MESFEHPFYDIDIEKVEQPVGTEQEWLVKILSVSAHRFSYLVRGTPDDSTVEYIRSLLDAAVFGDMIIERRSEGWEASESPTRLKKHS
jgi:hypothetical protein